MNPTLLSKLRHLRLSGMAEALPGRLTQATGASLPHLEFLELLVEDELDRRADRLFTRRLKQAEIVQIKEIKDFDWAFNPKIPRAKLAELAAARFVAHHEDVLLIGPPGVGKSHIATAIAVGAIRAGYRVLVRSAFDLAQDFLEAEALQQRKQLVARLTKIDLLVIEDFGMKRLGPNAAEDLLEVFVRRHESGSTLVTTNRPTAGLGRLPRRHPRRHRHPRPLPLPRRARPDAGQELPHAPAIPATRLPSRTPEPEARGGHGSCRVHGKPQTAAVSRSRLEDAPRLPQLPRPAPASLTNGRRP